jgi:long-subunit fatty acid transport protein
MHSLSKKLVVLVWSVAFLVPTYARANPDIPPAYDARSVGMGGTGTAFLEGASGGVYLNPALLDGVKKLDVALTLSPLFPKLSMPLSAPGTLTPVKQTDTEPAVVPLFLVAAGFRVHERITIGVGAYVSSGIGGNYKNVSLFNSPATPAADRDDFNDMKMAIAIFEASVPISVRVTEGLSLGAAWRPAYTTQSTSIVVPNPAAPGAVNRVEQDLSGGSLAGFTLGARYRANDMFAVGASYRNKMTMDLDGKTDITANAAPPMVPTAVVKDADTTSKWRTPHQLRVGSYFSLLDNKLNIALEGKMQLYKAVNDKVSSTIDLQGQPLMALTMTPNLTVTNKLGWQNAYTGMLGAEYWLIPAVAVRLGFTAGNSATSTKYPSSIAPPPGLLLTYTAGVGGKWDHWEAGLAASLLHGQKDVSSSDVGKVNGVPAAPAGSYGATLIVLALSAGYRM